LPAAFDPLKQALHRAALRLKFLGFFSLQFKIVKQNLQPAYGLQVFKKYSFFA